MLIERVRFTTPDVAPGTVKWPIVVEGKTVNRVPIAWCFMEDLTKGLPIKALERTAQLQGWPWLHEDYNETLIGV